MDQLIIHNAFKEFEVREAVETLTSHCENHDGDCIHIHTGKDCCFKGEYGCKLTQVIPEEWPEII